MEAEESRPRARTVFEVVEERHGTGPEIPVGEEPANPRWQLVKRAASRELDRFAALTGVLVTHLTTSALIWPILLVSLKVSMSAVLIGTGSPAHFTWIQAAVLTGGLWLAGPLCFFLYRYWSGKF